MDDEMWRQIISDPENQPHQFTETERCDDCGRRMPIIEYVVYDGERGERMWLCFKCRQMRQLDGQRVSYA